MPKNCVWSEDNDVWQTGCKEEFQFTNDGPKENGFNYCPYCGLPIKLEIFDVFKSMGVKSAGKKFRIKNNEK
jgi:hypothetical protein